MSIPPDQLRSLDTLRSSLRQLNENLTSISNELVARDPLPSWPQMESLQSSLAFTLTQLNETMTLHAKALKEAHVYPTSSFPGHKEGNLMLTLLRKKLDVQGVEWVEEFTSDYTSEEGGLEQSEMDELWGWASSCSQGIVGPLLENEDFGDDFTLAEREKGVENLRTGLRRKLWEEESGDEEDDGEKMEEDVMPERKEVEEEGVDSDLKPMPLEGVLRFKTTGAMPTRPNR